MSGFPKQLRNLSITAPLGRKPSAECWWAPGRAWIWTQRRIIPISLQRNLVISFCFENTWKLSAATAPQSKTVVIYKPFSSMFLLGMLRVVAVFPALAMEQTIFLPKSIPGDLEEHPELLRQGQLQSQRHRRLQTRAELSGSLRICHILLAGSLGGVENLRVLDLKIRKKKKKRDFCLPISLPQPLAVLHSFPADGLRE